MRAPGPTGAAAARVLARMARDPLAVAVALQREYGDVVRVPVLPGHALFVLSRPEHAERVLVARQASYVKAVTYAPLREFLGLGLVTSDGELWERQRRLMQPLFSYQRVTGFVPAMVARIERLVADWARLPDGAVVDVSGAMSAVTLDVVGETLFGADLLRVAPAVSRAVVTMQDFAVTAMHNPLVLPAPRLGLRTTPGYRRWAASVATVDGVIADLITRRRAEPDGARGDLLGLLLGPGTQADDRQIRDEIVTFLMAGHETSATVLSWALLSLSVHPLVRRRLEEEVDEVLGGRAPRAADVDQLVWTKAVLSETLRLYPPFWTLERDATCDDEVDGVRIPAGSTVAVPPYLVHRHRGTWDSPEGFHPERFLPGRAAGRHRYAFIPFAGGRRGCIGNVFALTEAVLTLAMLAQRYRLDLAPGSRPRPQGAVTLRPLGGLRMVLHRREGSR